MAENQSLLKNRLLAFFVDSSIIKSTLGSITKIDEIGDGNINFIFRIISKEGKSLVVKYAEPYLKITGPEVSLSTHRLFVEYQALKIYNDSVNGSCPSVFEFSEEKHYFIMEDLKKHVELRQELMTGTIKRQVAEKVGEILSKIHDQTHVSCLSEQDFKGLTEKFKNQSMVDRTTALIMTDPFQREAITNSIHPALHQVAEKMWKNKKILESSQFMRKLFREKKECLVHGDFHTESILVNGDDVKIIDAEFAYIGPASFDVGMFVANYIFSYYNHMLTEKENDKHRQFAYESWHAAEDFSTKYELKREYPPNGKKEYFENFWSEVAGMCSCELIRRTVGATHAKDIKSNPSAERECLEAGIRLMEKFKDIKDSKKLFMIALMLC